MVMTTGEFEFDTIFFSNTLDFAVISYVLWIIFIILMPVLLTNLLVSSYLVFFILYCVVCIYICVCVSLSVCLSVSVLLPQWG